MSGVTEIMDALAEKIADALDGVQVVGRLNFAPSQFPSIDIYPSDPFRDPNTWGFGETGGAYLFTVRARIGTADHMHSQEKLLALMDDEDDLCLADALLADQTLNGLVHSIEVDGPSGYIRYTDTSMDGSLLGVEWKLTVVNATS